MATTVRGLLKTWQPQSIIVRHRTKLNITRPRPPHFERALVEHISLPDSVNRKGPTHIPYYKWCTPENIVPQELTPMEIILAREAANWFSNSKLIAFFHVNSHTWLEKFQNKLAAKKSGMRYLSYSCNVMREALKGTIYEPTLVLIKSHTAFVVSEEPQIQKLLQCVKKMQKIVLMAAVVENRFLNYRELQYYGEIGNIEQARVKLLGVLNAAPQNLLRQVNHYPNNLVYTLNALQDQKKSSDKKDSK